MRAIVSHLPATLRERGLSQRDLADLTGIPYPALRRSLRSPCNPPLDDALRIAGALAVAVGTLFRLEEDPA